MLPNTVILARIRDFRRNRGGVPPVPLPPKVEVEYFTISVQELLHLHSPPSGVPIFIRHKRGAEHSLNSNFADSPTERILVTGGAGFIGSNFIRFIAEGPCRIVNYDKLTYAGNPENLSDISGRFRFVQGDVCDAELLRRILAEEEIDTVVHFAAESHVDRSILGPLVFTQTNVLGTHTLLEAAREAQVRKFIHISTDEVYGSLGATGAFTEKSPLDPTSPYAASKTCSDLIVLATVKTFGLPAVVLRCSNNYGPYQFPEKLIPLMITNAVRDIPLPVYGDGGNVRDWIHTSDYARAVVRVMEAGVPGEVYNVGGGSERRNIDIVRLILRELGKGEDLIRFVADRPAHDRRYAIDSSKIRRELGWEPRVPFEEGIRDTIRWYRENERWWRRVMTGEYRSWIARQYDQRETINNR